MNRVNITPNAMRGHAELFTAPAFDTEAIVELAVAAGMRNPSVPNPRYDPMPADIA